MPDLVIGNWEEGQRSGAKEGGKDYIAMNREGLKQGYIDSKVTRNLFRNLRTSSKIITISRSRSSRGRKFMELKFLTRNLPMESPIVHRLLSRMSSAILTLPRSRN